MCPNVLNTVDLRFAATLTQDFSAQKPSNLYWESAFESLDYGIVQRENLGGRKAALRLHWNKTADIVRPRNSKTD